MTQNQSFLPRTADETEQEIPRKDSEMKMLIRLLAAYSKKTACCQSKNIIIRAVMQKRVYKNDANQAIELLNSKAHMQSFDEIQ